MTSAGRPDPSRRILRAGFSLDKGQLIEQFAAMLDRVELAEALLRELTRDRDKPGHYRCVPAARANRLFTQIARVRMALADAEHQTYTCLICGDDHIEAVRAALDGQVSDAEA